MHIKKNLSDIQIDDILGNIDQPSQGYAQEYISQDYTPNESFKEFVTNETATYQKDSDNYAVFKVTYSGIQITRSIRVDGSYERDELLAKHDGYGKIYDIRINKELPF